MSRFSIKRTLEEIHITKARLEIYQNHLGLKNLAEVKDIDDQSRRGVKAAKLTGDKVIITTPDDNKYAIEREIDSATLDKEKYQNDVERLDLIHNLYIQALTLYKAVKNNLHSDWRTIVSYIDALGYSETFTNIGEKIAKIQNDEKNEINAIAELDEELVKATDRLQNKKNTLKKTMEEEIQRVNNRREADPSILWHKKSLNLAEYISDLIDDKRAGTIITEEHWTNFRNYKKECERLRDQKKESDKKKNDDKNLQIEQHNHEIIDIEEQKKTSEGEETNA
jgi:hypothetical protein